MTGGSPILGNHHIRNCGEMLGNTINFLVGDLETPVNMLGKMVEDRNMMISGGINEHFNRVLVGDGMYFHLLYGHLQVHSALYGRLSCLPYYHLS